MYYNTFLLCGSIMGILLTDDSCHFNEGWYGGKYRCKGLQLNELTNPHTGADIFELEISKSNLREIPENAFIDFPSIRILDLQKNNIEKVTSGAFNGLPNLHHLNLSKNNLTSLSLMAMPKLEVLYIYENRISNLDLKLYELTGLYMGDNLMTNLSFLEDLAKLNELFINWNRLSCVDEKIFGHLPLTAVTLSGNPWLKGCGASLVSYFRGRHVSVWDKFPITDQENNSPIETSHRK